MEQFLDCVVFLVATNLNNIDNVKLDYIGTLSETGLEQLLDGLIKKYYQAYVDGDAEKMELTLSFIEDIDLKPYHDASISKENAFDNLIKAFNNSKYSFIHGVDRINIKNLHQMCKEDPTINTEIMAIVDALHDSFIDKEKYKDEINGGAE